MMRRRVINPFSGKILSTTSPEFKRLESIGLKFHGAIHEIDHNNNTSSSSSNNKQKKKSAENSKIVNENDFLRAELADPKHFPLSPEKLQNFPTIMNTFNWEDDEEIIVEKNKNGNNTNNKNSKIHLHQQKHHQNRLLQVQDYLARGAEYWVKSKLAKRSSSNNNDTTTNNETDLLQKHLLQSSSISKKTSSKHPVGGDGGKSLPLMNKNNESSSSSSSSSTNTASSPSQQQPQIFSVLSPPSLTQLAKIQLTKDQSAALDLARLGFNLYLGGKAGTGKTLTLQKIAAELSTVKNLSVAVTATTGISALAVGGQTFHRTFGPNDKLSRFDKKTALIQHDVIIVDEISMFTASMLENFDNFCRRCRPWAAHRPFGGIQLIVSGDFLQLHVERKDPDWLTRAFLMQGKGGIPKRVQQKAIRLHQKVLSETAHESRHVFESPVFKNNLLAVALETKMRHKDDDVLATCLDELRVGKVNKALLSRCFEWKDGKIVPMTTTSKKSNKKKKDEDNNNKLKLLGETSSSSSSSQASISLPSVEDAIYLFPTRRAADFHNEACLARIKGETRIFEPKKVVLSPNGSWCEPVPVLVDVHSVATNQQQCHHQDSSLPNKNKSSTSPPTVAASSAFFKLPKNIEKVRRQMQQLKLMKTDPAAAAMMTKQRNSVNSESKIRIRPGDRISISAASVVEDRLRKKITEEMIAMNPTVFNNKNKKSSFSEPIVMHIDHRHASHHQQTDNNNNIDNSDHHDKKNKSKNGSKMKNKRANSQSSSLTTTSSKGFGGGCKNQLTQGVTLVDKTSLPVNIRIKKTDDNRMSLAALQDKMQQALDSLLSKGVLNTKREQQEQANDERAEISSWFGGSSSTNNNNNAHHHQQDAKDGQSNNKKSSMSAATAAAKNTSVSRRPNWDKILEKHEEQTNSIRTKIIKNKSSNAENSDDDDNNNNQNHDHHHHASSQLNTSRRETDRDVIIPRVLKVGSRVMLIRNVSPTLVNGSMGTLIGFEAGTKEALPKEMFWSSFVGNFMKDNNKQQLKNNGNKSFIVTTTTPTSPSNNEIKTPDDDDDIISDEDNENTSNNNQNFIKHNNDNIQMLPRVKFDNGESVIVPFFPEMIMGSTDTRTNFHNTRVSFMPLRIAYSSTVHKIQGCTIANSPVVLDLGRSWQCDHLCYVAASRVKKLDQLFILNWHERHLCVNEKAKKFSEEELESSIDVLDRIENNEKERRKLMEQKKMVAYWSLNKNNNKP